MDLLFNIKDICINHPVVKQYGEGEVFNINNLKNIKYPLIWVDFDNTESDINDFVFNLRLYYIDRLLDDKSNELDIQMDSVYILNDILTNISDIYATYTNFNITHFNQQLSDMCAGGFVNLRIEKCTENGYTKDIEVSELNLLPSDNVSYNNDTLTSFLDGLSGLTTTIYTDDTIIGDGSLNNPLSLYDSNFSKTINYNLNGTINNIVYQDGKTITYTYDIDNNIVSWNDGYRLWEIVKDIDGKIININLTKI